MMLQKVKRYPAGFIQGDDFPINECIGREPFTSLGDLWELLREEVFSPGPERYPICIFPGEAAIPVELNLVEPFLAVGQALNQPGIHGLDETDFCRRQSAEGLGFHQESERSRRVVQRLT